jgi:hypothetical protein
MKLLLAIAILLAGSFAEAAPTLPIAQALTLAQQSLAERGLADKYSVTSVRLEPDSVRRNTFHWAISWSEAIPISEVKKELGLEINMDGSVVSIVKGPANRNPTTGNFDPNGATGLQNHRTRSDRTSILDMKH